MLSITKTYIGFDEKEYTETAWFNMTKSEVLEIAMLMPDETIKSIGDIDKMSAEEASQKLIAAMGKEKVVNFTREVVVKAYGVRSEDGKYFKKDPKATEQFVSSMLFDAIYSELLLDQAKAEEFMQKIIPASLAAQVATANK